MILYIFLPMATFLSTLFFLRWPFGAFPKALYIERISLQCCHKSHPPLMTISMRGAGDTAGWHDVWDPHTFLVSCSSTYAWFQIYHFHLTLDCCWAHQTLILGGFGRHQLMMNSSGHKVPPCPIIRHLSWPRLNNTPGALFQIVNYSLL